jgi:hypothetical protein
MYDTDKLDEKSKEELLEMAKEHYDFLNKLYEHVQDPSNDLCTVGEYVLDHYGLWL